MLRSRWIGVGLGAVAALAVLLLWPRRQETPEDLIKQRVIQMAAAAEEKKLGFIMDQLSEDFRGTRPQMSRQDVEAVLAAQILRGQWVRVFVRDMEVTVTSPTTAVFRGKFVFGRSETDELEKLAAESRIQAYQVDADVRLDADGKWRFVTGGYRVIPPGELF